MIFSIFIEKQAFFILQIFCFFLLSCECLIILSGIFPSVNYFFQFFSFFCDFSFFSPFSPKTASSIFLSISCFIWLSPHPPMSFRTTSPVPLPLSTRTFRSFYIDLFLLILLCLLHKLPAHLHPLHCSRMPSAMLSTWHSPPEKSVYTA